MAIILLFFYALALFFMSVISVRHREDSAASFFVNNRKSTSLAVAFSIIVSCVGASATLGMIGMAFAVGTPAFWWLGVGGVGLTLMSLLLAKKVRESGVWTLPQMAENLLGKQTRPLVGVIIVIAWLGILAAQFSALTQVLQSFSNLPYIYCLIIGFVLVVGHTLGGQAAVMRTDFLQAVIIFFALILILIWLSLYNPSWASLVTLQAVNEQFPAHKLVYFLIVVGANYLVCPMLFGRLFSAKDEVSARLGSIAGALGILICAVLIVSVGLACVGLISSSTPQDAVLTTVMAEIMPPWIHVAVSFALLSAIVSSADSCLVTASMVLSFDLLGRRNACFARRCVFILGLFGACLSLWGKGIIGFLLMSYDVYACGVVAPIFIALILHKKYPPDIRFVCPAIIVGGICGLISSVSAENIYSYIGIIFSATLTLAGFLWRKRYFNSICSVDEKNLRLIA